MLKEIYYTEDEVEWENGEYDYVYSNVVNECIDLLRDG